MCVWDCCIIVSTEVMVEQVLIRGTAVRSAVT